MPPQVWKVVVQKKLNPTQQVSSVTCQVGPGIQIFWLNDCWMLFFFRPKSYAKPIRQHQHRFTWLNPRAKTTMAGNMFCLCIPIIPFILGIFGSMVLGHTQGGKWKDSRFPVLLPQKYNFGHRKVLLKQRLLMSYLTWVGNTTWWLFFAKLHKSISFE